MNHKITMRSFLPISEFEDKKASKIFAKVRKEGVKIVMKKDEPVCVLMDPDEYDEIMAIIDEYDRLLDVLTDEANLVTIDLDANTAFAEDDVSEPMKMMVEDSADEELDEEEEEEPDEELTEIEEEFEELAAEGLDASMNTPVEEPADEWKAKPADVEAAAPEAPQQKMADLGEDLSDVHNKVAKALKDFSVNDFELDFDDDKA